MKRWPCVVVRPLFSAMTKTLNAVGEDSGASSCGWWVQCEHGKVCHRSGTGRPLEQILQIVQILQITFQTTQYLIDENKLREFLAREKKLRKEIPVVDQT